MNLDVMNGVEETDLFASIHQKNRHLLKGGDASANGDRMGNDRQNLRAKRLALRPQTSLWTEIHVLH